MIAVVTSQLVSLSGIETGLRIASLLTGICVGIFTIRSIIRKDRK